MKKEMRVAVIHMEARRYYSLPRLFHECGVLSAFHTDIFVKSRWAKLLMAWAERAGIKGVTDLKGRYHEGLKDASIKDYKIFGIAYKLIWHRLQPQKRLPFMLKAFKIFNKLVLLRGVKKANVIYAFPGEAMGIFQSLELQTVKILDQNSVGYRYFCEVLAEERERWPGWDSLPHHFDDNISLIEREEKEWLLADGIIVPSDFVLEKLKLHGISDKKIDVVPYPADLSMYSPKKRRRGDGPLKVLFLGYVGLIKGIPYLLEAAERLGPSNICVRAVGEIQVARDKLAY